MTASIFLQVTLPNATTWAYFALLLAVALFFKFNRLLSVRNGDVIALFLLVPGLLLVQEAHDQHAFGSPARARLLFAGYLWLLCGSGYFLFRCLLDLVLIRRPALDPNLNLAGLAWLAAALFVCLVTVAARRSVEADGEKVGADTVVLDKFRQLTSDQVQHQTGLDDQQATEVRFWVERSLAIVCHLAVVVALVLVGAIHFQNTTAGMAAATFYLLLPYTAIHISQVHHVWPAALLTWAVVAYRRPMMSGSLLGLATGSVFFPALVMPAWLSFYRGHGARRFAVAFAVAAGLSLSLTGLLLWIDGQLPHSLLVTLSLSDWQPWKAPRPGSESLWTGVTWAWAYRLPVFILYAAFVLTTSFWPSPKNLAHVIALSAASLIGIQFWYADQGGVYVLWYLPLLVLMVFRPNLSDRLPPQISSESDWLVKLRGRFARLRDRFPDAAPGALWRTR